MKSENLEDEDNKIKKTKNFKNSEKGLIITKIVLVSILSILLSNFLIYFYPLCTSYTKYNIWHNNSYSQEKTNSYDGLVSNIMSSNADQNIKDKTLDIIKIHTNLLKQKNLVNFESLIYFFVVFTLVMLISALVILKNYKGKKTDKRYIGIALLIAAIVSAVICIFFALYGHYYMI